MGLREHLEGHKQTLASYRVSTLRRIAELEAEMRAAEESANGYAATIVEIDRVLATLPEPQPPIG